MASSAMAEADKACPGPRPLVYLTRRANDIFRNGVKEAYLDSRLFDVRLVCADGLTFWAHSLVLSVFSDFFAEMARLNLKEINLGDVNSEHVHLLLQLIYVGKVAIPLDGYADFIKTAKSLKLEKFVYQEDLSLHYKSEVILGADVVLDLDWGRGVGMGTPLDWDGVGSETATGSSAADDSVEVEGKLVIDEPDDQIASDGTSSAPTKVATVSPFNQTLLVEDVPVGGIGIDPPLLPFGQVALQRHPRIVFDSERQIMKVVDNGDNDDDDDGDYCIPQLEVTGHSESPEMLLLPPPSPPPIPCRPPPPPAKPASSMAPSSNTKPFLQCDECKRHFTKPHYLFVHKQLHDQAAPAALGGELKSEDGGGGGVCEAQVITCPVCQKDFQSRHAIMSHMKMHSGFGGVKPHYCDICNKTFAGRAYFRLHKKLHSGEKPYECPVCDKRFALRIYLTSHKKIHERSAAAAAVSSPSSGSSPAGKRRRTTSVASTVCSVSHEENLL